MGPKMGYHPQQDEEFFFSGSFIITIQVFFFSLFLLPIEEM
jgi:hypothetical protein